jgi:Ca-activated chloride channel homolog
MRPFLVVACVGLLATPVALSFTRSGDTRGLAAREGAVTGVVTRADGTSVDGAAVELRCPDEPAATTRTDRAGRFSFEAGPRGVCEVRAEVAGFVPVVVRVAVTRMDAPALRLVIGVASEDARGDAGGWLHFGRPAMRGVPGGVVGGVVGGIPGAPMPPPPPAALQLAAPAAEAAIGGRWHQGFQTAEYDHIAENRFRRVADEPLSTFSTDVDTASYSNVRRFLNRGTLPPADAVRVEELVNFFRFPYASPRGDAPVSITTEVAACPWNPRHRLALVGLQARRDDPAVTRARNLVFLLDVSGSMAPPDRLPLVQAAMRLLVDTLTPRDRVAIVVYAGASGLVLPSTSGDRKADIHRALDALQAGGSTNGGAGIQLAYDTAAEAFLDGGINRVILATDGDFNVGVTSQGELVRLIERQRERGIFLSVLGVGDDNLNDSTMEKLAGRGNGNYAYLDTLDEARRVLVAEASSTLVTVAKDVKVQVEFNPRHVAAYRLVGYENRVLAREDFNDDRKDAGDMGAGHTVTALYEIVPAGEPVPGAPPVDPLKYQDAPKETAASSSDELMTVKLRYKAPDGNDSRLLTHAVRNRVGEPSATVGFAAAVAQFGMLLRGSEFKGTATWTAVQEQARRSRGDDPDGYRAEFIRLVDLAAALQPSGREQTRQ